MTDGPFTTITVLEYSRLRAVLVAAEAARNMLWVCRGIFAGLQDNKQAHEDMPNLSKCINEEFVITEALSKALAAMREWEKTK